LIRWIRIIVLGVVAFGVISFGLDWTIFHLTGSPKSAFTVHHFVSAQLKNNKQDMDYTGSEEVPCSLTIYPQSGLTPCWYLRRHTNQVSTY
jgi:hypothetical protein